MTIYQQTIGSSTLLLTEEGKYLRVGEHDFDPSSLIKRELVIKKKQGRGDVYFFKLAKASSDRSFALRHYCRGGLVAKILYDKFFYSGVHESRCYEELALLDYLNHQGVNVPKPIAAKLTTKSFFYTADLITEVVVDTKELHEILLTKPLSTNEWENVGKQIRKMHDAYVCHDDINVKNVLIQQHTKDMRVFLIDFDKCSVKTKEAKGWQSANLNRLKRSLKKQRALHSEYFYSSQNWDALMHGYGA